MNSNELKTSLNKLDNTEFIELVNRLQIPADRLPDSSAPKSQRIDDVVKFFADNDRLSRLESMLKRILYRKAMEGGKTAYNLEDWVALHGREVKGEMPFWNFQFAGLNLLCVCDANADRMRIMAEVGDTDDLNSGEEHRMLQANFDSSLDTRYAIAQQKIWSVFLHPLSTLTEKDFVRALEQVVESARTYGGSYSSGEIIFQRGDTARLAVKAALLALKRSVDRYDVFVCYNRADKEVVQKIAKNLEKEGILPWADWDIRPGVDWRKEIANRIQDLPAAAVFFGDNGFGPEQAREIRELLDKVTQSQGSVIPVIIPGTSENPIFPPDLKRVKWLQWVDFRNLDPAPLRQLMWGITAEGSG